MDEQIGDLGEGGVLHKLLYRVAAVVERAGGAVNGTDGRAHDGRVGQARVERAHTQGIAEGAGG